VKIELLVNLKTSNGILGVGSVFEAPFPPEVQHEFNRNRGTIKIVELDPPKPSDDAPEPKSNLKKVETPLLKKRSKK
jgi:hypothetical protein